MSLSEYYSHTITLIQWVIESELIETTFCLRFPSNSLMGTSINCPVSSVSHPKCPNIVLQIKQWQDMLFCMPKYLVCWIIIFLNINLKIRVLAFHALIFMTLGNAYHQVLRWGLSISQVQKYNLPAHSWLMHSCRIVKLSCNLLVLISNS